MICPWCGSPNVDVPSVDNGVGMQQIAPMQCSDCHAAEFGALLPTAKAEGATAEELERGWWKGDFDAATRCTTCRRRRIEIPQFDLADGYDFCWRQKYPDDAESKQDCTDYAAKAGIYSV